MTSSPAAEQAFLGSEGHLHAQQSGVHERARTYGPAEASSASIVICSPTPYYSHRRLRPARSARAAYGRAMTTRPLADHVVDDPALVLRGPRLESAVPVARAMSMRCSRTGRRVRIVSTAKSEGPPLRSAGHVLRLGHRSRSANHGRRTPPARGRLRAEPPHRLDQLGGGPGRRSSRPAGPSARRSVTPPSRFARRFVRPAAGAAISGSGGDHLGHAQHVAGHRAHVPAGTVGGRRPTASG